MSGIYKTPGVYVEEIPKFPPSIAPVETAIPAFIGYTEKAMKNGASLNLKPTQIESIAEYETYFGGSPSQDVTVKLNSNNEFVSAEANAKLYMYDSLRMFYANGGGKCYIISIGDYNITADKQHFLNGLEKLSIEDEPTIILCPDAASLGGTDLYDIQVEGLIQSAKLMDRVVVCDLKNSTEFKDDVQEFRDKVGINNLKYGAAYGPWMNVSLPRSLFRRNLILKNSDTNGLISLKSLTSDTDIISLIDELLLVEQTIADTSQAETTIHIDGFDKFLKSLIDGYNITSNDAETEIKKITDFIIDVLLATKDIHTNAPSPLSNRFKIKTDIDNYINSSGIKDAMQTMIDHHIALDTAHSITLIGHVNASDAATFIDNLDISIADIDFSPDYNGITAPTPRPQCDFALPSVLAAANAAVSMFRFVQATERGYEKTLNDSLSASFGFYKQLAAKASEALNMLPPSGAIAGVYASVDRDRGVWKAPANVSLNAVIGPAVKISHDQQAGTT